MKMVSFTHSQVVLNLNEFLSSVKQVIMNNVGNQNSGNNKHFIIFLPIKVSVDLQLFGYPHS